MSSGRERLNSKSSPSSEPNRHLQMQDCKLPNRIYVEWKTSGSDAKFSRPGLACYQIIVHDDTINSIVYDNSSDANDFFVVDRWNTRTDTMITTTRPKTLHGNGFCGVFGSFLPDEKLYCNVEWFNESNPK